MPSVGETKIEFNRSWIYLQPTGQGPGTWRLTGDDNAPDPGTDPSEFIFTAVMAPGNIALIGSLLYLTPSGQAALADASSLSTSRVVGAATTVATAGNTVSYTSSLPISSLDPAQVVDGAPSNLTPGALYYLSAAVAGNYTTTPDTSTSGSILIQVGVALDTSEMNIEISAPLVI